jgi:hypothetical protein
MKTFVLISAIIELLAGAIMLLIPTFLPDLNNADVMDIALARMYGAAAFAVGYFCFQVWENFENLHLITSFFKTMSVFHIGVAAATFVAYTSGAMAQPVVAILLTILAVITI